MKQQTNKTNMRGTLHKTESGWQVWYHAKEDLFYGNTGVRILPLHDGDYFEVNRPGQYSEGKEVEFEIIKYPNPPHNPTYHSIDIAAKLIDKVQDSEWITMKEGDITVNFKPMPEFDDPVYPTRADQLREQAWDVIWKDFRANKNASYSWALLEYLRNNYNPPTKKQD
jgi:hypothetical protein